MKYSFLFNTINFLLVNNQCLVLFYCKYPVFMSAIFLYSFVTIHFLLLDIHFLHLVLLLMLVMLVANEP